MGNYVTTPSAPHSMTPLDLVKLSDDSRVVTRYDHNHNQIQHAQQQLTTPDNSSDPNLRMAIQSLDALFSQIVRERANQLQQAQQCPQSQSQPPQHSDQQSTTKEDFESNPGSVTTAALASLAAQMIAQSQMNPLSSTQHTTAPLYTRPLLSPGGPLYRCPMASNGGAESNRNIDEQHSKVNYKNLFPRAESNHSGLDSTTLNTMLCRIEELDGNNNSIHRRSSQSMANLMDSSGEVAAATTASDTIRINLPEILDQQDEITILRLLIKLLSTKVNKLSEEKRGLLNNVAMLSDINAEMAQIIERGIQK